MESLRLVSRQFRKQRLAVWAAGCGLDPYFTAMVFAGRGPDPHFLPWCFGSVRQAFERSFAGSAGRRANGRSETSF